LIGGAQGEDLPVGFVLGSPEDTVARVRLNEGRSEVIGERPACRRWEVHLGHGMAVEPDVFVEDGWGAGGSLDLRLG
jgi:hypothetical protein